MRLRHLRRCIVRASWLGWFLFGCAGAPFEQGSPAGSELAGSPSVAGSHAAGGSTLLAGRGGEGVAGDVAAGNSAGNSAGAAGAPTEPVDVLAGAAGEGGSSPSSAPALPECLQGWQGSACDACSSSTAVPGSVTCAELLSCYAEKLQTGGCDYVKPTSDTVVRVAHEVLGCLCEEATP
jgi:hypothetical protein